jgi:hypothetical protein
VFDQSNTKSRSRRCHNVWHMPRSNWMRRESTGGHFTLKLANSGIASVVAPGSSPPSRTSTTPVLTWGYMESAAGPESPGWHRYGTDSVRRPWHGMD